MHTLTLSAPLTRALSRRASQTGATPDQTALAILEAALAGPLPVVAEVESMREEAATRLADGEHILASIVEESRTLDLDTMRAKAVSAGQYLRAFLIDSAMRVHERALEGDEAEAAPAHR